MDENELPGPEPSVGPNDPDLDAYEAWLEREIAEGRERVPEEWELEGPAVSISLGDAADLDPALVAAMCGPGGLGGESMGAAFGQDGTADVLRPGPVLAALAEQAVSDVGHLSDDQLIGALRAARRQENRAAYQQAVVIAEFTRRRAAQHEDAQARKVPPGRRPGEFPYEELAIELVTTKGDADARMNVATDLTTRLPRTMAGLAEGVIDYARAGVIAYYTRSLTPGDAACADGILAAVAPSLRPDQLARRAAALEMKLAPEAVKARKEHAKNTRQRVEVRREDSGNAALSGRELGTADAISSAANINRIAARLRAAGFEGTLDQLRALVLIDLTQSRDPLSRIAAWPPASPVPTGPVPPPTGPVPPPAEPVPPAAEPGAPADSDAPSASGSRAPLPALINLTVPIGTLLGWSTDPAQAGGWGLLDPDETRDVVRAASLDSRTRWCMTIVGRDGTAVAHGCSPGQHPWEPDRYPWIPGQQPRTSQDPNSAGPPGDPGTSPGPPGPPGLGTSPGPGPRTGPPADDTPAAEQAARIAEIFRRLNVKLESIAQSACDHAHAEDRYTPSRGLRHLVRARTATCTAPGCNAQAVHCDLDHTAAYPGGLTCECNLGPKCRRHHRTKQAPGWNVEQPEPGVFRWTTPSRRTHITGPAVYDPAGL